MSNANMTDDKPKCFSNIHFIRRVITYENVDCIISIDLFVA